MGVYKDLQDLVNYFVGKDYRAVYLKRYPATHYKCKACAKVISRKKPREVHIDHIIPQKVGGTNAITNLQPLCATCNIRKHDAINLLSVKYSGQALLRELRKLLSY